MQRLFLELYCSVNGSRVNFSVYSRTHFHFSIVAWIYFKKVRFYCFFMKLLWYTYCHTKLIYGFNAVSLKPNRSLGFSPLTQGEIGWGVRFGTTMQLFEIFGRYPSSALLFSWQLHVHEGTKCLELSHNTEENSL